jgi:hypothetical protein
MSVLEKGLKKAGLKLDGSNALPKEQRTVKAFQRMIAAVRAAEAEVQDQLSEAQALLNEQLKKNLAMQEENERLRIELLKVRLKEGLGQVEALTVHDRARLLALSESGRSTSGGE